MAKIEPVDMARRGSARLWIVPFATLVFVWAAGFANFTIHNANTDTPQPNGTESLGIVVLTGSPDRIQWGMDALTEGRGERLLISGVNEITRRDELHDLLEVPDELFDCCVDLDYSARNTIANAQEAVIWAETQGFEGLWVVTSYYHMPRTMLEFHHTAPELEVYPIRVEPEGYSARNWWYPNTFRILAWEYTKYEVALMRIRLANFLGI